MSFEQLERQNERQRELERWIEADGDKRVRALAGLHPPGDGDAGPGARAALRAWSAHEALKSTYEARGISP